MYSIAVDIGGTFTDCVVLNEAGQIVATAKSASTPRDPAEGVLNVLKIAGEACGKSLKGLLTETDYFIHGCTLITNAMIERKGVVTGLITTKGHEDTIIMGRVYQKTAGLPESAIIHESHLHKVRRPVIDQRRIVGVAERVDYRGEVICPLDDGEILRAVDMLMRQGVQSIAVCLLWSFLNDRHERMIVETIKSQFPTLFTVASSEVAPLSGEYERTVTTVLTAYLGPKVKEYVVELDARLRANGYGRGLMLMHSGGGITTPLEISRRPLLLLDSGPVGGTLGGVFLGRAYEEPNVICTDVGGTSFDVSIIRGGQPYLEEMPVIDQYTMILPKIQINTIGAGGGSIVWVDPDGVLKVGPESAGADPGPACYGFGGERPTVTDADLLLGYLNPEYYLGGRQRLFPERARDAFATVATRLGMSILEAAAGAFRVVNAQMADLIRRSTIEKGYDPRDFILLSYGGAGPTHCAFSAGDVGVKAIVVPAAATVFSALGMLTADQLHIEEAFHSVKLPLNGENVLTINRVFQALEDKVYGQFENEGAQRSDVTTTRKMYMKFGLQVHELAIQVPNRPLSHEDQQFLESSFVKKYEAVYGKGTAYTQAGIEVTKYRVEGRQKAMLPSILEQAAEKAAPDLRRALKYRRKLYLPDRLTPEEVPVFDDQRLQNNDLLQGPCIVERMGDTVLIPDDMKGMVDGFGNIYIRRES